MSTNLWDRQEWDSPTAYQRFFNFYLSQPVPRSIDRAFRAWRASTGKPVAADRRAPHYWWWWAGGRDSVGTVIPGAKTWEERANAYDDHRYKQEMIEREREDAERLRQYRILVSAAFAKISQAWSKFNPAATDSYNLNELVGALRVISQEMRQAFSFPTEQPEVVVRHVDWRTEVLQLVKDGVVTLDDVREELGDELAGELFGNRRLYGVETGASQGNGEGEE